MKITDDELRYYVSEVKKAIESDNRVEIIPTKDGFRIFVSGGRREIKYKCT